MVWGEESPTQSGDWISRNWVGRDVIIKSKVFFSLVGKWTNCSKWWSFKISMNFSPSDWLSGEPDLLSLSGQTMSQKLKSPRIWTEGGLLPLCISLIFSSWLLSDLSCESSFSKSPPGGRYQLATKCEVLFANTFTQIDSESFSSSLMGKCEISLWISNITPPPSRVLSFLYTLYGQDSGNNSEVDMDIPAEKWYILMEPGNKVQTFFLDWFLYLRPCHLGIWLMPPWHHWAFLDIHDGGQDGSKIHNIPYFAMFIALKLIFALYFAVERHICEVAWQNMPSIIMKISMTSKMAAKLNNYVDYSAKSLFVILIL